MISEKDIEDMGPPQIHLIHVEEKEDGSALCNIELNLSATRLLIETGLITLLRKSMNEVHPDN